VELDGAAEEGELKPVQGLAEGVTAEKPEDVLVSVAAEEREAVPLAPLALPVGAAQAADTSTAFPTMASTSSGFASW
jgi:hypothetical protein